MNVLLGVVRGIILNNPIHCGDIQPPRCHIRTQQHPLVGLTKFEKGGGAFLLFLLAVYVFDGHVDVVEELCVVLDAVAAAEEYHNLFYE